jgi:hypothetical protein
MSVKGVACMMRHPTTEVASFGNLPRLVQRQRPLRKSKRAGLIENPPPSAPSRAQDWKLIGILTGAATGLRTKLGGTSPALGSVIAVTPSGMGGGSAGWCRGQISDENTSMYVKT